MKKLKHLFLSTATLVLLTSAVFALATITFNQESLISIDVTAALKAAGIDKNDPWIAELTSSVKTIGSNAFFGCKGLTNITIPNSVTSIGSSAFSSCSGLTDVTIPSSVTNIGRSAFSGCSGLTDISVSEDKSNYSSENGVLFNKNKTKLIQYPAGKQGAYTIPSSVTSIGSSAFSSCSGLTNITIPNSVTSIGSTAFYNCTGLTNISVSENNSYYSSENGVLFNKNKTKLIQYPEGKEGAYTIPSSVTSIGSYAFSRCSGLTDVTIPSSVTWIGNYAFSGCTNLTDTTTTSRVTSFESTSIVVYPNPTTSSVTINTNNGEEPQVRVFNSQGTLLQQTKSNTIDLGNYAKGLYLLEINGEVHSILKQ